MAAFTHAEEKVTREHVTNSWYFAYDQGVEIVPGIVLLESKPLEGTGTYFR